MEEEQKDNLPALTELSRRLHCPVEILEENAEAPEGSLSYIPWSLKRPTQKENNNDPSSGDDHKQQQKSFPLVSYLDLRIHQNVAWANDRLQEGNALAFCDPAKAESLFQQGLDLVPDHVDLLVGYGNLLAQAKRRPLAILKLQCALEIDPNHVGAKEQLERVQLQQQSLLRRQQERNNVVPVARESSVYQDVLMERSLALDSLPQEPEDQDEDEENNSSGDRRKESSRKHHHKKHHKKRRKRSRSPSTSSDDETSSDSSYAKRKKRKKRKGHHVSSDSSSSSSEDDDDRRRRKRKQRRRHHRKHSSKRKKLKREKQEHRTKDHTSSP
jgi:tetratricopeptide (TPR) repeat protein